MKLLKRIGFEFIMKTFVLTMALLLILINTARADWTIDLSRRTQQMRRSELNQGSTDRGPASVRTFEGEEPPVTDGKSSDESGFAASRPKDNPSFIEKILDPGAPTQDIVILNTERGFVPNTIRVRRDGRYMVHVVNVNEKEKNVSFILDGFSEHHATFFGKVKTFKLEPRKEGVYSFLSPETAVEGKIIVLGGGPDTPNPDAVKIRMPSTAQLVGE